MALKIKTNDNDHIKYYQKHLHHCLHPTFLASLLREEPRLARKILEPLITIIQNTAAKSLQYECIFAITESLTYTKRDDGSDAKNAPLAIKLCSDHLKIFIQDSDQNLKYLGKIKTSIMHRYCYRM